MFRGGNPLGHIPFHLIESTCYSRILLEKRVMDMEMTIICLDVQTEYNSDHDYELLDASCVK